MKMARFHSYVSLPKFNIKPPANDITTNIWLEKKKKVSFCLVSSFCWTMSTVSGTHVISIYTSLYMNEFQLPILVTGAVI